MLTYIPTYSSPYGYASPYGYSNNNSQRDRYLRALAEEQAAREAYAVALQRERERELQRQRKAQLEAIERERQRRYVEELRRQQQQQRAMRQSLYGHSPFAYGYQNDEDDENNYGYGCDRDEEAGSFEDLLRALAGTRGRSSAQPTAAPRNRSPSTKPETINLRRDREPSPPLTDFHRPSHTIPHEMQHVEIRSPSPASSIHEQEQVQSLPVQSAQPTQETRKQYTTEEQNEAASKIQSTYRTYRTRRLALSKLSSISERIDSLCSSFVFPASVDFKLPSEHYDPSIMPSLAYNSNNGPIHAYDDALVKTLTVLDAVESGGDVAIREQRKALVMRVEQLLSKLDEKKREAWRKVCEAAMPVLEPETTTISEPSEEAEETAMEEVEETTANEEVSEDFNPSSIDDDIETSTADSSAVPTPPLLTPDAPISTDIEMEFEPEFAVIHDPDLHKIDTSISEIAEDIPKVPADDISISLSLSLSPSPTSHAPNLQIPSSHEPISAISIPSPVGESTSLQLLDQSETEEEDERDMVIVEELTTPSQTNNKFPDSSISISSPLTVSPATEEGFELL